ncbi:MAG: insulinase family protein [Rhodobacteraceae bacterium]|nr:insulinase family protein [Paracoccaceae bacterium]
MSPRRAPALAPLLVLLLVWLAPPARAEIEIQEVTSPGGITAWLYEEHTIPMLALEARFLGGAALDPEGKAGAAALMAALLEEGSGSRDAVAFAEAREAQAAQFGFSASRDDILVSAHVLSEGRDESLALFRDALVAPRFDPAAFARVKAQLAASVAAGAEDPGTIASQAFYARVAPEGHPYGRPEDGTPETVAALTPEDVTAAHAATMVRDRLQVAVVGDITAAELGPLLDRIFGDLPESGPPLPPKGEPVLAGSLEVIELDTPQSTVVFGQRGLPRDDPDFIPAFVLDHILGGGGFGSRLTTEVREKRGLTYGIYTYLYTGDFGEIWIGSFSSANAVAAQAIDIVREEWARMAGEGVSAEELAAAKRYLTGAWPLRFDGNGQIAYMLLGLQAAGLDREYVNRRNDLVEAVSLEDVNRVAHRLLDPDALTFVVVGRPEALGSTN